MEYFKLVELSEWKEPRLRKHLHKVRLKICTVLPGPQLCLLPWRPAAIQDNEMEMC